MTFFPPALESHKQDDAAGPISDSLKEAQLVYEYGDEDLAGRLRSRVGEIREGV